MTPAQDEKSITASQQEFWREFSFKRKKKKIFIVCGIIVLAVVLILPFRGNNEKAVDFSPLISSLNEKQKTMETRVEELEERMIWLEEQQAGLLHFRSEARIPPDEAGPKKVKQPAPDKKKVKKQPAKTKGVSKLNKINTSSVEMAAEYRYYEVDNGDTLYRISLKYGMSVDELRRLNRLGPNDPIVMGQRLVVKRSKVR